MNQLRNQIAYGEESLTLITEKLKELGLTEVQQIKPEALQLNQYIKVIVEGGPFRTPVGVFQKAWTVYYMVKQ